MGLEGGWYGGFFLCPRCHGFSRSGAWLIQTVFDKYCVDQQPTVPEFPFLRKKSGLSQNYAGVGKCPILGILDITL